MFHYVDISSIDRIGKRIVEHQEIEGPAAPSRARKVIRAGDVLVSTVRPNLNAVAVVPDHLDGEIASTGFAVLRPKRQVLSERYLYYYCCTPEFVAALSSKVRGAQYPAVSDVDVRNISVPLPALSEQRRIVDILDKADRLRRLRIKAKAKSDRILPALFTTMFGDPRTNPKGWNTGKMGDALVETRYGTSARAQSDGAGVLVLRMNSISSAGRIDLADAKYAELGRREIERLALFPGDLVFNRTNTAELVGKTGLWSRSDMPAVPASYLIRCRVNRAKVTPEYIWALMNTPFMKSALAAKARRAVGMANINASELRRLPALFPPLDCQEAFVTRLRQLNELMERFDKGGQSVERLFSLLLLLAFSGNLTVNWREAHMMELLHEIEQQAKLNAEVTS